jgi:hypothetical protein
MKMLANKWWLVGFAALCTILAALHLSGTLVSPPERVRAAVGMGKSPTDGALSHSSNNSGGGGSSSSSSNSKSNSSSSNTSSSSSSNTSTSANTTTSSSKNSSGNKMNDTIGHVQVVEIPVVQVQLEACASFMNVTLRAALKHNRLVYLISNPCPVPDGVQVFPLRSYSKAADEFRRKLYRGGTNGEKFESMCFMRFFVLRDFMAKMGVPKVLYADGDVLISVNVTDLVYATELARHDLALTWLPPRVSASTAIFSLEALQDVTAFFESVFRDFVWFDSPGEVNDMQALRLYVYNGRPKPWECWGIAQPPGTCHDSPLLREKFLLRVKQPSKFTDIGNLGAPIRYRDGWAVFDNMWDGDPEKMYSLVNSYKRVTVCNQTPYFHRRDVGNVLAAGIHFQGLKKSLLPGTLRILEGLEPPSSTVLVNKTLECTTKHRDGP